MREWIEGRLVRIEYAFTEFPVLKWRSIFFVFLVLMGIFLYQPLIIFFYKFNIMGAYIFQDTLQDNLKLVIWGQAIVPLLIAIWGYLDVSSLYEQKYLKRYKCLPNWVD